MHAATALLSLLQHSSQSAALWRADEDPVAAHPAGGLPTGFRALDAELPDGGWPRGQLTEVLLDRPGIGELSLLTPALAAVGRQHCPSVWVLPCDGSAGAADRSRAGAALPYAPALAAAGITLARTLFVQPAAPRESLWAVEQALRAEHLGAVVGWLPAAGSADSDFRALRRLHLLAQRHRALAFVLRDARHAATPSPAALRLHLAAGPDLALQVRILKRRGRPLLEPVLVHLRPDHWQRDDAAPRPPLQPVPLGHPLQLPLQAGPVAGAAAPVLGGAGATAGTAAGLAPLARRAERALAHGLARWLQSAIPALP